MRQSKLKKNLISDNLHKYIKAMCMPYNFTITDCLVIVTLRF